MDDLFKLGVDLSGKTPSLLAQRPVHFQTGEYRFDVSRRLEDEMYGRCLDSVVIIHAQSGKVLLVERKVYPQKEWWLGCGGRMLPGETPFASMKRVLTRKLNVKFDEDLFLQDWRCGNVASYSFLWAMRKQSPAENGTADISVVVYVELDGDDLSSCVFTLGLCKCEEDGGSCMFCPEANLARKR